MDVDKVLLRWKLDDGQYRVIYGDLRIEDVSPQKLAELEAEQPAIQLICSKHRADPPGSALFLCAFFFAFWSHFLSGCVFIIEALLLFG